jgi:hypoxanthine phosphoribosyltransferase
MYSSHLWEGKQMTAVALGRFNELLKLVIVQLRAEESFKPDTILALSTGGFPFAAALAKKIGISSQHVIGLPVYKDADGSYCLDSRLVSLGDCTGRQILIVDEASNRGILMKDAVSTVVSHGGTAMSCVLVACENGILPDFVAETCVGKPPKFYWEE